MNINQYAVYQLKESAELAAYRSRSYQYLVEQHFHMTVQNYQQAYFTKLFTSDTPEMIRKRLEEHEENGNRVCMVIGHGLSLLFFLLSSKCIGFKKIEQIIFIKICA